MMNQQDYTFTGEKMKTRTIIFGRKLYPPFKLLTLVDYLEKDNGRFHHAHPLFQTVISLRGTLKFRFPDGPDAECSEGELLSIPPDRKHLWIVDEPCLALQCIHMPVPQTLYGELYSFFGRESREIRKVRLPNDEFRRTTGMIVEELNRPSSASSVLIHAGMLEIFALAVGRSNCLEQPATRVEETVQKTIDYIENNLSEKMTLSQLASASHISSSRLSHIFHEYTGKTPIQYINEQRIERAENLLLFSNMNISETADALGFRSIYYFSRIFKKIRGISPSDFAANARKGNMNSST